MDFKNLGKKSLEVILSAALGAAVFSSYSNAAETGDRYGCIAKSSGTYFTNGKGIMKDIPCTVDPAVVDNLIATKNVDRRATQVNFNHKYGNEVEYYGDGTLALYDVRKIGEAKNGPFSPLFPYLEICQKGNLEKSEALLKVKNAFSMESEPSVEGIAKQTYSNCESFNKKPHYKNVVFEQSIDNKNQMLMYTANDGNDKRKLMGLVNWVENVTDGKVSEEVAKAQKKAKKIIVKSTDSYVNDFNEAQNLLSGNKLSYGHCKEARDILNRDIRSLRASTGAAKGYLEQFEKLRANADLNACLAQMTEERLARYNETGPVAGIGIEGKLTVFNAGVKKNGWTATGFYGTGSIKQDPQSILTNGRQDALGYSRQLLNYAEFDSDVKRIGFELARDAGMRSNISLGYRNDKINEKYSSLETLRTLKNGNVIATQQRDSNGEEKIKVDYVTVGLGYAVTENVTFSARAGFPFKIKESEYGNKYGKTEYGASINYRFDTKPVNRPKNRGFYQKKAVGK